MLTFRSFSEDKAVTLSGGGKTVTLKPGQNVSFKHHETGKTVSGTFRKKKMMGGRQYAHVDMPDKTGMYIPVHHINESFDVNEETMQIGDHAKLAKYADERGGIDKDALHTAAKHMKSGDMDALKKHLRAMDTDPRDKAIEHIDKSHLKTLGYTMRGMKEEAEQVDEGKKNWDKVHRDDMHNTLSNRMLYKKSYRPVGQKSKAELRKEIEVALIKNGAKMKSEEVEQVDEKLSDEAKKHMQTALGPKTKGNAMRKTSAGARELIKLAKKFPKNMANGSLTKDYSK